MSSAFQIEQVYAALFTKASGLTGAGQFVLTSRRLQMIDEMGIEQFPAFFQRETYFDVRKQPALPPIYDIYAMWYVYVYQADKSQPMTPQLNALVDLLRNALQPTTSQQKQTLGLSTVTDAYINGRVDFYEGLLDDRALAILPIKIIAGGW